VTEDPLSIQFIGHIDSVLTSGEWPKWRNSRLHDRETLVANARAWCASSYWNLHTPNLEDWKEIVQDISASRLTVDALAEMAGANSRRISFPPIPLFEREQMHDMIGILQDPLAAAVLAEQLASTNSLLTVQPDEVPKICWDRMQPQLRERLEYPAWRWLVFTPDANGKPWPGDRGMDALWGLEGSRRDEALRLLEAAATETVQTGAANKGAAIVLDSFARLRNPKAPLVTRLETFPTDVDRKLSDLRSEIFGKEARPAEYERLCRELFDEPLDLRQWKALEEKVRQRTMESREPHPLSAMADYLREQDFSIALDQATWEKFIVVLQKCGGLLELRKTEALRPLPALELAASIRSNVNIGAVAVDLIAHAGPHRRNRAWWASLKAGLRPMVRRGGWTLANDRTHRAIAAVASQSRWLVTAERQALENGFAQEIPR
jgi:hypothetical protein